VESIDAFLALAKRWPKANLKLIEDKANGPAMQTVLQRHVPGIVMVTPDQDKAGRLRAVAPFFRSGNVFLPSPEIHPWAAEVGEELVKFPNSEYYWGVPGSGPPRWKSWEL
jgi:predicted phage terminase large subunit-like protein